MLSWRLPVLFVYDQCFFCLQSLQSIYYLYMNQILLFTFAHINQEFARLHVFEKKKKNLKSLHRILELRKIKILRIPSTLPPNSHRPLLPTLPFVDPSLYATSTSKHMTGSDQAGGHLLLGCHMTGRSVRTDVMWPDPASTGIPQAPAGAPAEVQMVASAPAALLLFSFRRDQRCKANKFS